MSRYSKAAVAVLALAFGSSPLLAQGYQQGPPPPPPGQQGGQGQGGYRGFGPNGGPNGAAGEGSDRNQTFLYRKNGRGDDFGRGDRGRFGRRGEGRGGHGFGGDEVGLGMRLLDNPDVRRQIGITDEQAAKIRGQASEFRKAEIRDRADLQVKRLDLQDLLASDKPDRAAIDSKLQEISAAQLTMEKSAIDFRLNMRDAITPAQREKIRQLMMNRGRFGGGQAQPAPQGRRGPQGQGPGGAGGRGQRGAAPTPGSQAPAPPPSGN